MNTPKGSKFTKRFGQKSGHKFMRQAGKPVKNKFVHQVGKIASVEEWIEKEAEEEAPKKKSEADYHEIVRMVAEAYGIDLTTPESLDNLPAILREADKIMEKREQLESCESELADQLSGGSEGI